MQRSIFSIFLLCTSIANAHHKIIFQISPPRSLSTAALRMWQARGDVTVMNEPAIYPANLQRKDWLQVTGSFWHGNAPRTYQDLYQAIMHEAESSPVFVKEISFSALSFLLACPEIIQDPQVHFVFLMRNPHDVIVSFYKVLPSIQEDFNNVMGFRALYQIWQMVNDVNPNKVVVISSEELSCKPHAVARDLCAALNMPFYEHTLSWQNLGSEFDGKAWHDAKKPEFVYLWHKPAITSTNFSPLKRYQTDQEGYPTFAEITNEEDRAACFAAYADNMVYYKKLLNETMAE